jgi:competence ComEA-like helix-hairpin-helix protein
MTSGDSSASLARGMALCGLAVVGAGLLRASWPAPPALPVQQAGQPALCRNWTADGPALAPRTQMGCGDADPQLCLGDGRQWDPALSTWRRQPGAMRGSWRRLVGARLDLNHASAADLALIDGIGPRLAAVLVAQRRRLGAFVKLDQLRQIRGIGPAKSAALRGAVQLGPDQRARVRP